MLNAYTNLAAYCVSFLGQSSRLRNAALPLAKFQMLLFRLKMSDCAVFDWPGLRLCKLQMFGIAVLFHSNKPSEERLHDLSAKQQETTYKISAQQIKADETQTRARE